MALIKCKNCGNFISDKAKACPKCGAENKPEAESEGNESSVSPEDLENDFQDDVQPEKTHKSLYLLLILTGVIILGGIGYYFYSEHQAKLEAERVEAARIEQLRLDSIEAARVEAARIDSLRRDSVIRSKVPRMKDFVKTYPGAEGVCFKDDSQISKVLKKQGYDEIVNKRWVPADDYCEAHEERDYVWSCDSDVNIKVVTGYCTIILTFGDEYTQKLFVDSFKEAGFIKGKGNHEGDGDGHTVMGTVYHHPKSEYWSGVWIDVTPGKVFLIYYWEP